jgi:excisionase family DNA binding protein
VTIAAVLFLKELHICVQPSSDRTKDYISSTIQIASDYSLKRMNGMAYKRRHEERLMEKKTMTVQEIHETYSIPEGTLRQYLREGKLKGRRVGKLWYVAVEEIDAFMRGGHGEKSDDHNVPSKGMPA